MLDIDVDLETMRQGASELDVVADNVKVCVGAANSALSSNAFGLLCSPVLLPGYEIFRSLAVQMMNETASMQSSIAQSLRQSADDFEQTDQLVARSFESVEV